MLTSSALVLLCFACLQMLALYMDQTWNKLRYNNRDFFHEIMILIIHYGVIKSMIFQGSYSIQGKKIDVGPGKIVLN